MRSSKKSDADSRHRLESAGDVMGKPNGRNIRSLAALGAGCLVHGCDSPLVSFEHGTDHPQENEINRDSASSIELQRVSHDLSRRLAVVRFASCGVPNGAVNHPDRRHIRP
jgi:hypothetical protein